MRKKIVAANWKMNMLQAEAAEFVKDLLLEIGDMSAVEVVIVPPFTAIAKVVESLERRRTSRWARRTCIGNTAARLPAKFPRRCCAICLFVTSCWVTASGARCFGETDEIVNRKVRAAHRSDVAPDCLRG